MGLCYGKNIEKDEPEISFTYPSTNRKSSFPSKSLQTSAKSSPQLDFGASPSRSTPRSFLKKAFLSPSPAKHIQAALRKRQGSTKSEGSVLVGLQVEKPLNKNFGYSKNFTARYELGHEVGRGHFGHTYLAKGKKGDLKEQSVAIKIISKSKMTTVIAIEDVKREVKILKALSGHPHVVRFYDAFEDTINVYIVMELCEGGELLDRILARGGKYFEEDAKVVISQILSIVAFCHFQGVVHRDLKPENFLFTTKKENASLKAIDFGLSGFIKPDERLNDIVGSAYYVAPEVLHRSYSTEADVWSIGVISYILLCGSRPFWARTESGIFRAVLRAQPSFDDSPWPSISPEAKDFVKKLLDKDLRKRMTAAQALTHPWIRADHKIPLDLLVFKSVKAFLCSFSLKRAALKALSKTIIEDDLVYLRAQFILLEPSKNGHVSFENFKVALTRNTTEAMKESRVFEILSMMHAIAFKMDFREFCAAAISVHQLEGRDEWEYQARAAYDIFDKESNRLIVINELAQELGLGMRVPAHAVLHEWIRQSDGKLSFVGFIKLLHGVVTRPSRQSR